MIQFLPSKRITIREALSHYSFSSIRGDFEDWNFCHDRELTMDLQSVVIDAAEQKKEIGQLVS